MSARRSDLKMMAFLIRHGADPTIQNTSNRTALRLIAIREFSGGNEGNWKNEKIFADFSKFINNPAFSDIILKSSDGVKYFCHKIVLSAQSPVFEAMFNNT
jgi:hypothetical protein